MHAITATALKDEILVGKKKLRYKVMPCCLHVNVISLELCVDKFYKLAPIQPKTGSYEVV